MRVKLDSAKSLNEAYAEQVPIEPLLVKHRLLALTNAPLADRLSVLRKLAELDPVSACWGEDVGQFEQARFSILKSETAAAIKAGDLSWIDRLLNEVMAEPWRTPVPEALKQALATASTALHQTEAIGQLRGLVPRIQEALSAMNPEECKRVAAEWGRIVTTAKVPVPADLLAEYLPLSQWLEQLAAGRQQDRSFRAACDELAAGIDLNAASEDLRQRYRRAAAFQMGLPEELEREYQRKLTALEREQKQEKFRQHMVAMVLVIAVAAAIGALVYVLLFYGKH
ncbi:MAG TPA: hypothetical protein VFE47_19380 [Tepidisphaeraceae bacterium]|nr:hypothetical protein [Tepidisphaeraceae bacterium]